MKLGIKKHPIKKEKIVTRPAYAYTTLCNDKENYNPDFKYVKLSTKKKKEE